LHKSTIYKNKYFPVLISTGSRDSVPLTRQDGTLDVRSAEADSFLALWGGLGISLGLVFYGKRVIQ
jgi:hypothetical protein